MSLLVIQNKAGFVFQMILWLSRMLMFSSEVKLLSYCFLKCCYIKPQKLNVKAL